MEINLKWQNACNIIKSKISASAFKSWISPLIVEEKEDKVTLLSTTRFINEWIKKNYASIIITAFSELGVAEKDILFKVAPRTILADANVLETSASVMEAKKNLAASRESEYEQSRYTFENFVTGSSNEFAYAASVKVAQEPGSSLNPLFLYSSSGLGKTHLMQAIAGKMKALFGEEKKIIYLSAEKFLYTFIKSLRDRDSLSFKEEIRSADVLMIDDLHFLDGKVSTAEEFYSTFNALIDEGKQIILSADKAPSGFIGFPERLRSRLASGLVVDIGTPDFELRFKIAVSKAASVGVEISEEVLAFIAENVTINNRVLEGAVYKIANYKKILNREVDLETAKNILADLLADSSKSITLEEILKTVADKYALSVAQLKTPSRARNFARPRQIAMYLAKTLTSKSLPEIGRTFGDRDHTTVLYAVRRVEELMELDSSIASQVQSIRRLFVA